MNKKEEVKLNRLQMKLDFEKEIVNSLLAASSMKAG